MCTDRIGNSCSNSGTCRCTLATESMISHERGNVGGIVITTNGTYPWPSVTDIFRNGQQRHDGDRNTFTVITLT